MSRDPSPEASIRVSTQTTSPVLRELTVEVDAARVRSAFERAYRDLARRVRVRGFRPGKTPRSVLEKLYGGVVVEDIERMLVAETLPEAVSQAGVEPVSEPSIDAKAPVLDAPFRYVARVEVKPAVELPSFDGLTGTRPSVEVSDADVERELEGLRQRRARLVDEPAETAAATGHTLLIDYVGRIDGASFEGGSARGALVEIGSGHFLPGFEEQLVGARAGDDREVAVTFPAEYGDHDLAGRNAAFAVHVEAVRRREVPVLDDDFARGFQEFANLDELRARVRQDLERMRERESRGVLRRTLLDWILARTEFEVPPGLIEQRLEQRLAAAHRQLAPVVPDAELHARMANWREEWRADAVREVREDLVLETVAVRAGLEVSDAEVDAHLEASAREQGLAPERLRRSYTERGILPAVRAGRLAEKALDELVALAKIVDQAGS